MSNEYPENQNRPSWEQQQQAPQGDQPIDAGEGNAPEETHNDEQQPSEHGGDEVAQRLHEEQAKGYSGEVPDETPNEAYTVAGVTKTDQPQPEN